MQRMTASLLFVWVSWAACATAEEYKPLFPSELAYGPNTVTAEYAKARQAATRETAIVGWESFLAEHHRGGPADFADATELALIRQAHYELARLYYLAGRVAEGDRLLGRVDDLTAFEVPDKESGAKWCQSLGYCR